MNHYMKLLFSFVAVCLLSVFASTAAQAEDLPPLEDDPMAYYYSEEYIDRSNAYAPEGSETQTTLKNKNILTYKAPSVAIVSPESYGITHDDRFEAAKKHYGIDVSYYQGDINWNAVKSSGVEFVFIRVGYRGLTTGGLNMDTKFNEYMQGALSANLKVGVYFFSQAITPGEAIEEANYTLERIAGYNLSLPVVIDYEYGGDGSRLYSANLSKEAATSVCAAFCNRIASAGYSPMIYANKNMLENNLDGASLGETYKIWLAHYTEKTSYANKYSFWQYTSDGYVNGISGRVDMDVWYDTSQITLVGSENARKYVIQLYNALLGRDPDPTGLAGYMKALTEGTMTASRLVTNLMESNEYKSKRYSDTEYIKRVYQAMLNRDASPAEANIVMTQLNNGVSRRYILSILSRSAEFTNYCAFMQMERGTIDITENRDRNYGYTSFVMRCYEKILGRKADAAGLNTWTGTIFNGGGGVSVVYSLINSDEFRGKRYSNSEYVERMYQAMLGRGSDPTGKADWVNQMNQGVSHLFIVRGFCGSVEFRNLCANYGMHPGSITLTEPRDQNFYITSFVNRCYQTALQRSPDLIGLNNWCSELLSKRNTPESVAYGFVFSPEANIKYPSNEAFVEMLYRLCLGRGSDPVGRNNWISTLQSGTSRYTVFLGFTRSDEFRGIIRSYGF